MEKLVERPEERAAVEERHGLYFLAFVRERHGDLLTDRRRAALAVFDEELPNVAAAWRWAVASHRVDELQASTWALDSVYSHRPIEGHALFAEAIAALDEDDPDHEAALGHLVLHQGHFIYLLEGVDTEHEIATERVVERFRRAGDVQGLMGGLIAVGMIRLKSGDVTAAREAYQEGPALARVHGTPRIVSFYLYNLVAVERELADAAGFEAFCKAAMAELERLGDTVEHALVALDLGIYLTEHDREREGEALVQAALTSIRALGDPRREPHGLLSRRAIEAGDYAEAEDHAQRGLAIATNRGGRLEQAGALTVLGRWRSPEATSVRRDAI